MVAKKKTKKKSETQKQLKKKTSKKKSKVKLNTTVILKKAPKNREFILADGRTLKDLRELAYALENMNDETFMHHVNDERNDFSTWTINVFSEEDLGANLKETRDRIRSLILVLNYLVKKIEK